MKQISINIPDNQFDFMMELLKKFDFVKINPSVQEHAFKLTQEQKILVESERIKVKTDTEYLMDWDAVIDNLKTD